MWDVEITEMKTGDSGCGMYLENDGDIWRCVGDIRIDGDCEEIFDEGVDRRFGEDMMTRRKNDNEENDVKIVTYGEQQDDGEILESCGDEMEMCNDL